MTDPQTTVVTTLADIKSRLSAQGVNFGVLDAESTAPGIAQTHIDTALRTLQKQHAQAFGVDYPYLQSSEAGVAYVNDPRVARLRAAQEFYNAQDALADPARNGRAATNVAAAKAHMEIESRLTRADGSPCFNTWEDHSRTLSALRASAEVELSPATEMAQTR
ncbi:MAG: hypothetical protein GC134_04820 [Proteobacteria bacterium]|nr:hypothetical protein [Pseudomonadota bacterium]